MAKEELVNNYSVAVDGSSTRVSGQCFQQRTAIIITNNSPAGQVIYVSVGQAAAVGSGVPLSVGGVYQDTRDGQYFPSNKQINAISSAAGGIIAVQERVLMDTY